MVEGANMIVIGAAVVEGAAVVTTTACTRVEQGFSIC